MRNLEVRERGEGRNLEWLKLAKEIQRRQNSENTDTLNTFNGGVKMNSTSIINIIIPPNQHCGPLIHPKFTEVIVMSYSHQFHLHQDYCHHNFVDEHFVGCWTLSGF